MAILHPHPKNHLQIHRLPQSNYIDAVRWVPPISAFDNFIIFSLFNSTTSSSTIELHSLDFTTTSKPFLSPLSSIPSPSLSRTSSLKTSTSFIAFSTFSGALNFLFPRSNSSGEIALDSAVELKEEGFHVGPISCVDVLESECVSVGEDGRVNVVAVGGGKPNYRRVCDSGGLVCYTAVKWASPSEFATGGLGCSLQWWDQRRKPGEPSLHFKGSQWPQKTASGVVHSIDIHPSRKHTCMAGGSSGTVFAWDLRWPQQPIILSGAGIGEKPSQPVSESEVWEVQFDCHSQSSNIASMSSSMLPAMMCSEDGILAVLEPGSEPVELLEEPCAINSFDIDKQNYDVICSLEWESIAIISRS